MNPPREETSIVYTQKASCRDCHRCLRGCPVKAIRIVSGQASVVETRCIHCGTCIRECPQHAKVYRSDIDLVAGWIAQGDTVVVTVAPSFASVLTDWERSRLPSVLRRLGLRFVAETAVAAEWVARRAQALLRAQPNKRFIWTSCPSVVGYLEARHPELHSSLLPVATPMIAHGRALKARFGPKAKTVFIGPCVAKKAEARNPEANNAIDAVLTFEELFTWMSRECVTFECCEASGFDESATRPARLYPLEGGSLRLAGLSPTEPLAEVETASGIDDVVAMLEGVREGTGVVELLFCKRGCISGPAAGRRTHLSNRLRAVAAHAKQSTEEEVVEPADASVGIPTKAAAQLPHEPDEERIQEVLERTGKSRPEDQLNCGACGYESCRAKAIAVIEGMADPAVCIPVMRRLAEQRSDRIMETSPNGIVILDQRMGILAMNPAFRAMFRCTGSLFGRHISEVMDPEPFQRLAAGAENRLDLTVTHRKYGVVCRQILYTITEDHQYVGIFVNITQTEHERESLERLRKQTLTQGRELLEHQIEMAQQLTRFLGESTAKGETLVQNMLKLTRDPAEEQRDGAMKWLWDIYTSKS